MSPVLGARDPMGTGSPQAMGREAAGGDKRQRSTAPLPRKRAGVSVVGKTYTPKMVKITDWIGLTLSIPQVINTAILEIRVLTCVRSPSASWACGLQNSGSEGIALDPPGEGGKTGGLSARGSESKEDGP